MIEIRPLEDETLSNAPYGPLRSFRDIVLAPNTGWATHHHRNVEVITLVLAGEMTQKDARDEITIIPAGTAHRLSAGVGVTHAEHNLGTIPARFLQAHLDAEIRGVLPEQDMLGLKEQEHVGALEPILSGDDRPGGLLLYQDATVYLVRLADGQLLEWNTDRDRLAYAYVYEGRLSIDQREAATGQEIRVSSGAELCARANGAVGLVLIDLPA